MFNVQDAKEVVANIDAQLAALENLQASLVVSKTQILAFINGVEQVADSLKGVIKTEE